MTDLVDWADVAAVKRLAVRHKSSPARVLECSRFAYAKDLLNRIATDIRTGYYAGLADAAPKTCGTCQRWKRAELCSLNPESLRFRTYCDRDFATRNANEFCSDHEPRK